MKLSDFDFELPEELIAQKPAQPRDHARLLVYDRASGKITDDIFYNLDKYLVPETALVLNDSRVEKCRLRFDGIEIFVTRTIDLRTVEALVKPGKKFMPGKTVELANGLGAETVSVDDAGSRTLKLSAPLNDKVFDKYRLTPFPPYIKQDEKLSAQYQTVYADESGSKAAPTAGLHFTRSQLKELATIHPIINLTLHVGLGTFAPVRSEKIDEHKMHAEEFFLDAGAAQKLNAAKHITAVGTTSARVLETIGRPFNETSGSTSIFVTPGYEFKAVDSLITNFHLPKSTLLMMVAALIGSVDELQHIYQYAIKNEYRFYSFGDAMLIV